MFFPCIAQVGCFFIAQNPVYTQVRCYTVHITSSSHPQ